jgi:rhodanese-related sulfurtransferase
VPKYLLALLILALPACAREEAAPRGQAAERVELPTVSVDELASLIADGKGAAIDANNQATRERQGVIPGATILSHFERYDLAELPDDRSRALVFYCANEHCGASHAAAEKAKLAGWTDVRVLPAGITGWKKAGKATGSL